MAATITDLANGTSTASDATLATGATVTGVAANGDWFIVFVAAANSGASGAPSLTGIADSGGSNVYTQRAMINFTVSSTASDGATLGIYTCPVTANITSGTITASFSTNTPQKTIQVYRVTPGASEAISFIDADTTGLTGFASSTYDAPTVSVANGDIIFGAAAIETDDAITGDSDTTNGSWSTIVSRLADSGLDPSAETLATQYKTVTGTGNQSWACTTSSARDSARTYLVIRSATGGGVYSIVADTASYDVTGATDTAVKHNWIVVAETWHP